jgi:cytoplasmic FMR1 interacting protein
VTKSRYDVIMRQRHFQILGRALDLNALIAERMHTYLKQNIDYAISRFEASDLTAIVELEDQFLNIRLAHKMMSQYFEIDSFDKISFKGKGGKEKGSTHALTRLVQIFLLL